MHRPLLRQQITTHLSAELAGHPEVRALLASVGEAYQNYEQQLGNTEAAARDCRKQLEAAVQEAHKRNTKLFSTPLANMHAGILIETADREVFFTNERFCQFFQLEESPEELVGANTWQYSLLKKGLIRDAAGFFRSVSQIFENRETVSGEVLELTNGTVLEWNYVPILVEGTYDGHFWEFRDVTEQVRDAKHLAESEERHQLVLNASLDAVIIADEDRSIEYWNPRAEALFGWSAEEACGQRMNELLHPRGVSEVVSRLAIQYPEGDLKSILNHVLEFTAVRKDGKEFPVELIVVPFRQHGKTYYCKFVKDISYRKQTENRLRAQEEWYRNIIANMKLGMVELGPDEIIVGSNESFLNMCGYGKDEIIGNTFHKLMPSKEELEIIRTKQVNRTKGISDKYEIPILNKEGETRWWLVSASPNYDEHQELLGSVGIILDITEQKRMEADLARARDHAEQASIAKEAFLANMSHEIRTPLNGIIGMIRELGREKLTPQQQTYLGHTDAAARHLLSIVNSILDISKIEAGEMELDAEDFSLEAVMDNIRSILHGKVAHKELSFSVDLDPALWPAYRGDPARFRQVLINLLDNAIKFTAEGSVCLQARVMGEAGDQQSLRISITDSGIGMDEEYLDHIFAKFSQAEKSTSRRFGGTGLGMSITKEILRLMNGTISVTSQKNRGTTFTIDVSLERGNVERLSRSVKSDHRQLEGARLLLVEDNLMNRFIARKSLSHFGCTVDEAENGRKALEYLEKGQYDLILMDIQMPELDGCETTKIIREELHLDIPIIAVTANAFKQDIDRYLAIGMNDYVTKPFEESQLFSTLALHLHTQTVPVATALDDHYDLSQLLSLSRGDESFVREMVNVFVEHTPATLQEIRTALDCEDYSTLATAAHRIKPSIDSLGIHQLHGVAKEIERTAKSDLIDGDSLARQVTIMTDTLERVVERLRLDYA